MQLFLLACSDGTDQVERHMFREWTESNYEMTTTVDHLAKDETPVATMHWAEAYKTGVAGRQALTDDTLASESEKARRHQAAMRFAVVTVRSG